MWEKIKKSVARVRHSWADSTASNVDEPQDALGLHWRPSVNRLLDETRSSTNAGRKAQLQDDTAATSISRLPALPTEILHLIDDLLLPVDAIALRQTCRKLQHDLRQDHPYVHGLNARQRYSLRRRLDRDSYPILCSLETRGSLAQGLAACSFCLNIHPMQRFTPEQLHLSPEQRQCTASSKSHPILGHYHTSPAILRLALEDVLSTGRDFARTHHWIPEIPEGHGHEDEDKYRKAHLPSLPGASNTTMIQLSTAIEPSHPRLPALRSTLLVDTTGLLLEHHFHFSTSHFAAGGPSVFHGACACPHMSLQTLVGAAKALRHARDGTLGGCFVPGCGMRYRWNGCEQIARRRGGGHGDEVCFLVQRGFGWVESLEGEVWAGG